MVRGVGGGVRIVDTLGPSLDRLAVGYAVRVESVAHSGAEAVESYAKQNAPWADRTGAARAGLTGDVEHDGLDIVITLSHTVDYGLYLELIQDGRFAIIMPTLDAFGPSIQRRVGGAMMGKVTVEGGV